MMLPRHAPPTVISNLPGIAHHPRLQQQPQSVSFLLQSISMAVQNSAQYLVSLFGLQGKTVLITGGTRGIGAGLTVAL